MGRPSSRKPLKAQRPANILPKQVDGVISPYPTY